MRVFLLLKFSLQTAIPCSSFLPTFLVTPPSYPSFSFCPCLPVAFLRFIRFISLLISSRLLSFHFLYFSFSTFHLLDTVFVCACGSPGAGRNHVTPRYYRHFNIINYVELSAESMQLIFSTVLTNFLSTFEECVSRLTEGIVRASIAVYNAVLDSLKPTPSKPHYTFNLRDMSKVTHHHPLHFIFT